MTDQAPVAGAQPRTEQEQHLFQRLAMFGLLEADGKGGWRLTERGRVSLAALKQSNTDIQLSSKPATVRPWMPRKLGN